jgi:two-component system, sensor histidine kinase LadS
MVTRKTMLQVKDGGQMYRFFLAFLIALLAVFQVCHAGEPERVSSLPVFWQSLLDTENASFDMIRHKPSQTWQGLRHGMVNYGFTRNAAWLKTSLKFSSAGSHVLELANPILDEATLYIVRSDGTTEIQSGGYGKSTQALKLVPYHNQLFEFNAAQPGETVTLYLRIAATRPLIVWPRLFKDECFYRTSFTQRLWLGTYGGMFFALSLLSLMVWFTTRDSDYFDFLIFIATGGLLQAHILGLLHEQMLGFSPAVMVGANVVLPLVATLAYAQFARRFLSLERTYPLGDRIMRLCMLAELATIPLYAFAGAEAAIPTVLLVAACTGVMGLYNGFVAMLQRNRAARFYVIANSILVVGGCLHVGNCFHLFDPAPWVVYVYPVCAAFNVVVIAFALADKVHLLQQARIQAREDQLIAEQQMIEVLRESESDLETRVLDRTNRLEEAVLQQRLQREALERTHKILTELHEERGAFLQIAAHDLKNPTAAIVSYADLLRERWQIWDDEKKLKRIGNIRTLAQLSYDIISNLLDINAIESGHFTLRPQRINPEDVLHSVYEAFRERADAKDIRVEMLLPNEPMAVMADKLALHQIIENLMSNAVKYSPQGSRVHVRLAAECGKAMIEVRDEGPGISEEDQTRLFRKFTRLSARPTGGEHSTGLGLSIVKHITEASGGHVGCISRLGEGATFYVSLPLAA